MSLAPYMGCLFPHVQFEYTCTLLNISVIECSRDWSVQSSKQKSSYQSPNGIDSKNWRPDQR